MKPHYFLYLFLLGSLFCKAQNVSITDEEFKTYLLTRVIIDTNNDNEISVQEAEAYHGEINIFYNRKIYTLAGIEAFINITYLNCAYTNIDYLDISKNTALTKIQCDASKIASLDLSKNTALQILICGNMPLTTLDLSHNTALTSLDCSRDSLTSLDLSQNTQLQRVNCGYNKLTSLTLGQQPMLEWLDCNKNLLSTLDISQAPKIVNLNGSQNKFSTMDVSHNPDLKELKLSSNLITSIDVSNNINLTQLLLDKNNLTELHVELNKTLTRLDCQFNQLKQLELKNQEGLYFLFCQNNFLGPVLDVSHSHFLGMLDCSNMRDLKTVCVFDKDLAPLQFIKDSTASWSNECSVGIQNISSSNLKPAYPNPFTDEIHIGTGNTGCIYNVLGELMIPSQRERIQTKELPGGVYYLILTDSEKRTFSQKLIKY